MGSEVSRTLLSCSALADLPLRRQSHLEWTTEVTFQPFPHLKGPSAAAPQSFTTMPHSSSATLHAVLTSAMTMRDKKGKGKEAACTPEETKWREREKKWLRGVAPDEEEPKEEVAAGKAEGEAPFECAAPSTTTPAPDAVAEDVDAEEEDDEAEPPFLLLLAVYTPPPASSPSTASDEPSNPNLVQASSASSTTTAATTSSSCKKFHLLPSLALTLRSALQYTTLLEYPSFELWSREAFLRARLMGKLEVVDKPRELPVDLHAAGGGGGWERGRGRGRGRGADRGTRGSGRGRGGGRGGSAGAGGGRGEWSQREEEVPVEQRVSDAGWGKRALAPATDAGASAGDFEIEIELDMGAGDEGGREEKRRRTEPQQDVELPTGLSGLVGYESD